MHTHFRQKEHAGKVPTFLTTTTCHTGGGGGIYRLQFVRACVCVAVTPHLVPVCVTPPPPLHLSLLRCPSFKSTFFIATLLISFPFACVRVCLCAGIPEAGVNQAGSVGGGCGGEDGFLQEGDPSPAEAAERKTGG